MDWNEKLIAQNRKILLILDNFSGHKIPEPTNIKFLWLPPNTTSLIQPLDQGIIQNFKSYYKKFFMQKVINFYTENKQILTNNFNLYNAIEIVSLAWMYVGKDTIVNCFNKLSKTSSIKEKWPNQTIYNELNDLIIFMKDKNLISEAYGADEFIEIDSKSNYYYKEIIENTINNVLIESPPIINVQDNKVPSNKEMREALKAYKEMVEKRFPHKLLRVIELEQEIEEEFNKN